MEDRTLLSAGDLDPTFGMGGKITTDFQGPWDTRAGAAALQPDGKIVVVGRVSSNPGGQGPISNTFGGLARYDMDGNLDPTFGNGGLAMSGSSLLTDARAVIVQPDGRIIVGGMGTSGQTLARYNSDGSLDVSFGGSGIVISRAVYLTAVALQPDDKIVAVGEAGDLAVMSRYNPDGSLDATFGAGGTVMSPIGSFSGVTVQPDGRIIVLGASGTGAFLVARYNPDGTPDASFGTNGMVTTKFVNPDGQPSQDQAKAGVVQADGKIVVGGTLTYVFHGAGGFQSLVDFFDLARYNSDGSLDLTFGSGGKMTGPYADLTGLALQGDSKIVAAGTAFGPGPGGIMLQRFAPDGTLDPTFGTQGTVYRHEPQVMTSSTASLLLQENGRIVVAGTAGHIPQNHRFALDAFTPAGSQDTTFGISGGVTTAFTGGVDARVSDLLLQPDGKIVVVGNAGVSSNYFAALARYNADGTLDSSFGSGGKVTTIFAGSSETFVTGAVLQPDGKILIFGSAVSDQFSALIARYNAYGSLDGSFGMGGTGFVTFRRSGIAAFGRAILLQPDGKFVVAFELESLGGIRTPTLARFNADGSQDASFVADLSGLVDKANSAHVSGLAIQEDSKIVVSAFINEKKFALMRLNPDGSPDQTFGTGGSVMTSFSGVVRVQVDGRIVVVGSAPTSFFQSPVALARFYANGNPDTTFGTAGKVVSSLKEPSDFELQPDGKIVVAARTWSGLLAVGRFDPDGAVDVTFGTGGVASADLTAPVFGSARLALEADGRIVAAGDAHVAQTPEFGVARFLGDIPISDTNQRFVTHIYLDLLGRSPDASGLASFTTALNQGQFTRIQVVQIITNSPEYHTMEVQGLYGRLLGRPADPSGLNHWVAFLNQGGTPLQLEAILMGSAEYFSQRGGGTVNGFLQTVYSDVLRRPIDASGAQAWSQVLSKGITTTAVATAILASQEADQTLVQDLYRQILHRPADASGLDSYSNALQQGLTNEQLLAILAGSDEYFARL